LKFYRRKAEVRGQRAEGSPDETSFTSLAMKVKFFLFPVPCSRLSRQKEENILNFNNAQPSIY
jgi:hypothetical protein